VRRFADVVRDTLATLAQLGFEGCGELAATLARAGWKLARVGAPPSGAEASPLRHPQDSQVGTLV
jgi:hypothetical protein